MLVVIMHRSGRFTETKCSRLSGRGFCDSLYLGFGTGCGKGWLGGMQMQISSYVPRLSSLDICLGTFVLDICVFTAFLT